MERTTNLEQLRQGKPFTWGKLIQIHDIGDYSIVEYHPGKKEGVSILVDNPDVAVTEYNCYYKIQSLGISTYSLDSALAICIAYKYDGGNSQAATFFMRMIGAIK